MISTKWWFTFRLFGFFMIGVTGGMIATVNYCSNEGGRKGQS